MQPIIYVAGPYRAPDRASIARNIEAARQVGIHAARLGWYPIIPHTNTAHMECDLPDLGDEFWLRGTLETMERCDALVLVSGWESSHGTRAEIERADQMQLPVFRGVHLLPGAAEFVAWLHASEGRRA